MRTSRTTSTALSLSAGAWLLATVTVVGLLIGFVALGSGFTRTAGGEVAVIRNGGPFDDNQVRGVVDPGSSRRWTGMLSAVHRYPAQQRFYTITSDAGRGERPGVDVVQVPSSDGVEMGIEATIYFTLTQDHQALRQFDDRFGTRTFRGFDDELRAAYDGEDGWSGFLDAIVRPVIDNDLREQVNDLRCSDLVSSCALVQNGSDGAAGGKVRAAVTASAGSSNDNITKVQQAINTSLEEDLRRTLGGDFLTDIRFNLVKVTLPTKVQDAVNDAQAAFASITKAQALVQQAKAEAEANRQRQQGYHDCPACAQIDQLKAIPSNVTTYAPGAGFAVTPSGR